MGTYDKDIQKAYVAFFNRPADVGGLSYWNDQATKAGGIAPVLAAFGASDEYKALYAGKTNYQIVETVFQNLFNRAAEPAALSYWGDRLSNGTFNLGNFAYSIFVGAQNADKTSVENKVTAASAFTTDLNTNAKILAYETITSTGSDAVKAWLKAVTSDTATIPNAASVTAIQTTVSSNSTGSATVGKTFTLTKGADAFTGTANNDTFTAADTAEGGAVGTTWSVGDALDGGAGNDTFNLLTTAAIAKPTATSVANIETFNATSGGTVTLDTSTGYSGLTALNTTGVGGATVTAAATTDVSVTDSAVVVQTDAGIAINGGKNVTANLTAADATSDNAGTEIVVGNVAAAAGTVAVTLTGKYVDNADNTMSTIGVTGGTAVTVTTKSGLTAAQIVAEQNDGSNNTITQSAITVTGNAATTAVTVTQEAAVVEVDTAGIGRVGIKNGAVTINDKNAASATVAGTIATATLNNYGNSTIDSNALTTVNLSGTGGTLGITTNSLTTPVNTALALNLNGLSYKNAGTTNAITVDSDVKTLNVTSSTAASTVSDLLSTGATAVNVAGDAKVTFTASSGLGAVTAYTVTNTGGAVFGSAIIAGATFTGGAGADGVVLSNSFTKAITMGAGDDIVTVGGTTIGTGGSVAAGDGIDTIKMSVAQAKTFDDDSTFNTKFTGFETLQLSDANTTNDVIDLDGINAVTTVKLDAAVTGNLTLNNLASNGTVVLTTDGAATPALTVGVKSALVGGQDTLNLTLSKSTAALAVGSVTAANVENIKINVADAAAAGSDAVTHTMQLVATTALSVVVTGNNGLTLNNASNTKITNFDASGVVANDTAATKTAAATTDTAAKLAVTFASANNTATDIVTIKGGAGDDVLSGNTAKDTITGGAGADKIYSDNAGTKAIETYTVTTAGAGTATITLLGEAITGLYATTGDALITLLDTNIKASANYGKLFTSSVTANGGTTTDDVLTVTYLVDGANNGSATTNAAGLVINTTGANGTAVAGTLTTTGTVGTVAIDTVDGGAGADFIVGGGGADSLTGGTGVDTFFMLKGHSNQAALTSIADYTYAVGGSSNDKLNLGDVVAAVGSVTKVQDLSAQSTLAAAFDAAALGNSVNNGLVVFIHGGNTYAYVETTGTNATYTAGDFAVKLVGTPLTVDTALAGLGFDSL